MYEPRRTNEGESMGVGGGGEGLLSTPAPWWRFVDSPGRVQGMPQLISRLCCMNNPGVSAYCTTSSSWREPFIFAYI